MTPFHNEATVEVDGRELRLVLDIAAIDAVERKADTGFPTLFNRIAAGDVRVGQMAALLWGLLRRKHPQIDFEEAGALAIAHGKAIGPAILELVASAFPDSKEGEAGGRENPPKAARKPPRGTGKSST
jgi:hypothetical protein